MQTRGVQEGYSNRIALTLTCTIRKKDESKKSQGECKELKILILSTAEQTQKAKYVASQFHAMGSSKDEEADVSFQSVTDVKAPAEIEIFDWLVLVLDESMLNIPADSNSLVYFYPVTGKPSTQQAGDQARPTAEERQTFRPRMFVSTFNLLARNPQNGDEESEQEQLQYRLVHSLNLDPRRRYFDASIWNRYVPLFTSTDNDIAQSTFPERFQAAASEIAWNLLHGTYGAANTHEYIEFENRMFENSYLKSGDHAKEIRPFQFHSESWMRNNAHRDEEGKANALSKCRWHFLWVDDQCRSGMKALEGASSGDQPIDKQILLRRVVSESISIQPDEICFRDPDDTCVGDCKVRITQVKDVTSAKKLLENRSYDAILLDYLLGETESTSGKGYQIRSRERGTKLISSLLEFPQGNIGPLKRFWIFPTTAFSQAMLDEIRSLGLNHHSDIWYISTGADPVNTPHLFAYKLNRFLKNMIAEVAFNICDIVTDSFKGIAKDSDEDVRKAAKACYPEVTRYLGNFHQLYKDKSRGSRFAESAIELFRENNRTHLLEHAHYLMYLLAYAPAIHWAKMWDEYNVVVNHPLIMKCRKENKHELKCFKRIRDYIIRISKEV